jgi:hypothetical protein
MGMAQGGLAASPAQQMSSSSPMAVAASMAASQHTQTPAVPVAAPKLATDFGFDISFDENSGPAAASNQPAPRAAAPTAAPAVAHVAPVAAAPAAVARPAPDETDFFEVAEPEDNYRGGNEPTVEIARPNLPSAPQPVSARVPADTWSTPVSSTATAAPPSVESKRVVTEIKQPAPAVAAAAESIVVHKAAQQIAANGEAPSREVLSAAAREIIERVVWEVVPELAETLIREEIQRLLKPR